KPIPVTSAKADKTSAAAVVSEATWCVPSEGVCPLNEMDEMDETDPHRTTRRPARPCGKDGILGDSVQKCEDSAQFCAGGVSILHSNSAQKPPPEPAQRSTPRPTSGDSPQGRPGNLHLQRPNN